MQTRTRVHTYVHPGSYKFILKRVLGDFLCDDLNAKQFDVHLREGILEVRDLNVNVAFINTLLVGTPVRLKQGRLGRVRATIAYRNLLRESCVFELDGLSEGFGGSGRTPPRVVAVCVRARRVKPNHSQ